MTAPAVPRETSRAKAPVPRPVATLDDILLELVDIDDNVRDDVGDLTELQASIAELGVLSPVKVTLQSEGRYRLVYGQRRVLACRELGRLRIRAIVEPASDVDATGARRSIEQLAENLQRKDLNPIEEAVALREVLDADPTLTQEALADKLAMSRPWVSNTLGLLEAIPFVQEALRAGTLTAAHAKALKGLPGDRAKTLAEAAVTSGSSAHDLERNAQWAREDMNRTQRDKARLTAIGKSALKALEKVAPKDALIVAGTGAVRDVIRDAGWSRFHDGDRWSAESVKNAGECGCATWLVEWDHYGSGKEAKVRPGCVDDAHRAERQAVREAAEAEELDAAEARTAALRASADADRNAIVKGLRAPLEALSPGIRRGLLFIVANDHSKMLGLQQRHGGPTDSTSSSSFWATIAPLTDDEVLDELAIAIASSVIRPDWYAEQTAGARALLVAEAAGDDEPTPVKKGRKAAAG